MKIDLKKLTGNDTASIPFSETLDLSSETFYGGKPFKGPVHVSGKATNETGVLRLAGTIEAVYSTSCARCLKPLEIPLKAVVDTILSHDPEAEEDEKLFVVTGDTLDTSDIMVPALFLEVRMTYLCREDCKGICPICGVNRNETECGCGNESKGPLFEALRGLLDTEKQN